MGRGSGADRRTPIPKVEKPTPEARETVITPAEFEELLALFPDQEFRDVLITCWETGCRPNEVMRVEARHVEGDRWVFKVRESKGKRSSRIVFLPDRAAAITRRQALKYPTGPLFRNIYGKPWAKDAINKRFRRKRPALGRDLCLYHLRHSFAHRMLLAGIDALVVASWMGHKDTSMISRVYGHLMQQPDYLHERLKRVSGDGGAST